MLKLALDFDSVLSDTMVNWVQKFNKRKDTSLTKNDVISWTFWNDFDISIDEAFDIFAEVWSDWKNLPPTEHNLQDKVMKLTKICSIDVVTAVQKNYLQYIKKWLNDKGIIYENFVSSDSTKANLDYDVFIDDSPSIAQKSSQIGKICLLYDQPWNRKVTGKNIIRIKNLNDAYEFIKKINQISIS